MADAAEKKPVTPLQQPKPQGREALKQALTEIERDAAQQPERYARDTRVPEGGE